MSWPLDLRKSFPQHLSPPGKVLYWYLSWPQCNSLHPRIYEPCSRGILQFSQHGLEKYNDITTKQYFRATNHKGEIALHQIMEKQNRLEHLRDTDTQTQKVFSICCSNCGDYGHNKLTCSQPCKTCKYPTFQDHLVDIDGRRVARCEKENIWLDWYISLLLHNTILSIDIFVNNSYVSLFKFQYTTKKALDFVHLYKSKYEYVASLFRNNSMYFCFRRRLTLTRTFPFHWVFPAFLFIIRQNFISYYALPILAMGKV